MLKKIGKFTSNPDFTPDAIGKVGCARDQLVWKQSMLRGSPPQAPLTSNAARLGSLLFADAAVTGRIDTHAMSCVAQCLLCTPCPFSRPRSVPQRWPCLRLPAPAGQRRCARPVPVGARHGDVRLRGQGRGAKEGKAQGGAGGVGGGARLGAQRATFRAARWLWLGLRLCRCGRSFYTEYGSAAIFGIPVCRQ